MARGGVNKAVVQTARAAILARGENPSIDAVRIEMGNTGSKTTIHRYLKELDEVDNRREAAQEGIDDELSDLVGRLAQRLREQAQEPIDRAQAQFEAQRKELEARLVEAQAALEQLKHEHDIQGEALSNESSNLESTRSMLQTEQTRNAGLNQACSDYELRLKDKDEQVRSLEEKHLHARDALEHFRNATKEQREQEQRRHEGQMQQVQMELRQAQQSALVRQDEITQLHRDNERLLTENRVTQREMFQVQEQLREAAAKYEQVQAEAGRVDAQRNLIEERLRVATLESEGLKQQIGEHQQQCKALELKLVKTEGALESLQARVAAEAEKPGTDHP